MYSGKVVVIAGGSKGLGFEIARSFAVHGAQIVLLARNQPGLTAAVQALDQNGQMTAASFSVDLTDERQVVETVKQIIEQFGGVDVWINAVGQSIRTSFEECQLDSYRQLMEQNFFASVNAALAAIPALTQSSGSLVLIGSLAAKTAWPYLAPYVASKHALAGFAKQIRLEGPKNVHCLFVCPGPIHSKENKDRYSAQAADLPESANKPGAGAPVKAIDPTWLARKIVDACERRKPELVIPFKTRLLFIIAELWPNWATRLIRRMSKN